MSGKITGVRGVVTGRVGYRSVIDEAALRRFVDLAVRFRDNTWRDVDPAERDGTVMAVLLAAGHDATGVVVKNLRGQSRDQDGPTGETYIINSIIVLGTSVLSCPLTVTHEVLADPDSKDTRTEDDYSVTHWLNDTVSAILRENSDESMLSRLVLLIEESLPLEPIELTYYGDRLTETYSVEKHVRDSDTIWKKSMRHDRCCGILEMHQCSDAWRTLACRKCGLRLYVPANITTFGELRASIHRLVLG